MKKQDEKKSSKSPGLLQKWFGSSQLSPEMESGINIARSENPNTAPIEPYGLLSRMLLPNAQGYTSPGGTIYLNPTMMQGQSRQDVADTIVHEQQHVNQMKERGYSPSRELLNEFMDLGTPYYQRPDELAAYQAEKDRRAKMNRMQTAIPSFDTGEFYAPKGDIYLRPEKK